MKRSLFKKLLSASYLPVWAVLLADLLMVFVSCVVSFAFRYDIVDMFTLDKWYHTVLLIMLSSGVMFLLFRPFMNVLRTSSFVDLLRIFVALTMGYGIVGVIEVLSPAVLGLMDIKIGVIVMAYVINLVLMCMSRISIKLVFDFMNSNGKNSERAMIYGAKAGGVNIAKSLRIQPDNRFRLKGFIADEHELIGKTMMGLPVVANDDNLIDLLHRMGVQTVIVSPLKMDQLKQTDFADRMMQNGIKLLAAPPLSEWNGKNLTMGEIKEIQIEDLLQREPIKIDMQAVSSHLEGKRVMITGAAGSIGSEIMRQVASFNPYMLILVDQAETPLHDVRLELMDNWRNLEAHTIVADIANKTRMEKIFAEFKPQYVFHAAAYKHVPMMEDNVSESIQTNVAGTKILADLAVKYGASKFVMVSTDKAVNPTNVMGCSKRICEIYVQSLAKKLQKEGRNSVQFITTRFGNVLGSNGSVIPRFKEQIAKGGPVTVTHPDIIRYFMTIPEACRLVLEAGSMGQGGEIYIFDMGKPMKILDLAKRMIQLSGRTDVKVEFTGLRHGEKLYEELLNVKELTKPTHHEKIMIANVREYDYDEVEKQIEHLVEVSYTYDQMKIVAAMKELVPEFISKNSCFEVLDKK